MVAQHFAVLPGRGEEAERQERLPRCVELGIKEFPSKVCPNWVVHKRFGRSTKAVARHLVDQNELRVLAFQRRPAFADQLPAARGADSWNKY